MKTTVFILTLFTFATLIILPISFAQEASTPERMVRMIYFLPNDRTFRPEVVQSMQDIIRKLQSFFAEQMQAHGHGKKTFRFETDDNGEPKVHCLDGLYSNRYYLDNLGYWLEVDRKFDRFANNVYFLVWDNSKNTITSGVAGTGGGSKRFGQLAVPAMFSFGLVAHELGHAFGLGHDFRDGKYIMSYGPGQNQLSACAAEFLAVHPYFNPDVPSEDGKAPTIELLSPHTYTTGSESVKIRIKVSDPDGVHQVLLFALGNLIACRELKGEKEAIVEFEYEGVNTAPNNIVRVSDAVSHTIGAHAVDTNADTSWIEFNLSEISEHHIHAFGDHTNAVHSLAFSPDSKKIASGGWQVAKLWDVATQQDIATFEGGTSVAFSPNGRILATTGDYKVRLWDVETQRNIATFLEHSDEVYSVAFSPDGTLLASGNGVGMIKLWDVETQRNIFTFEAYKRPSEFTPIQTLAFSPDGKILASGSYDRIIKLWDVTTGKNTASIREDDGLAPHIYSLAFSPDGTILASGKANGPGNVKLWDVGTKRNIATFYHKSSVYSVAFSPDGRIIASGSRGGIATLRNISTSEKIVELPHTSAVRSVAFSPDGTTLASGTSEGIVNLWDLTSFISHESAPVTKDIIISEIMVTSNKGHLPQWIELHNRLNTPANLNGLTMTIDNYRYNRFGIYFDNQLIEPKGTLLIVSKQGHSSKQFGSKQVFKLPFGKNILSEEGFYIRLYNYSYSKDGSIMYVFDEVGNLDKIGGDIIDELAWPLPTDTTKDGARTSMIRRQDDGTPLLGTKASGWISAKNTKLHAKTTHYYGHPHDIGAPGDGSGEALPVTLSRFSADRIESGVVLRWTTEAEVDNAGFYIYRSETKDGEFKVVNPTMIQGAGTTGERNEYTWMDTTAKPNTVYYYRIEDVSQAGVQEQLATVRLRRLMTAIGKLTTRWADLKVGH